MERILLLLSGPKEAIVEIQFDKGGCHTRLFHQCLQTIHQRNSALSQRSRPIVSKLFQPRTVRQQRGDAGRALLVHLIAPQPELLQLCGVNQQLRREGLGDLLGHAAVGQPETLQPRAGEQVGNVEQRPRPQRVVAQVDRVYLRARVGVEDAVEKTQRGESVVRGEAGDDVVDSQYSDRGSGRRQHVLQDEQGLEGPRPTRNVDLRNDRAGVQLGSPLVANFLGLLDGDPCSQAGGGKRGRIVVGHVADSL
mmetsp:Transcript_33134/g.70622  ORF Transcript_33134/g.70622 Transcript_33134/m.70622 type:complete len:251 (-) Transcript_33134:178-930(-)